MCPDIQKFIEKLIIFSGLCGKQLLFANNFLESMRFQVLNTLFKVKTICYFFFCKSHGCLHVLWKEAVLKIFAEEESTHSRHLFSNTSYCRCLTWKPKFIIGINTISIGEGYVWAIVIQHEERNLTEYWHISESWHKSEFQVRLN